ncbi:MAG: EAL domain-containing protein [Rhodoferax sp.]|nr:EAL domain-containing protein [Rhodoferax sp.]
MKFLRSNRAFAVVTALVVLFLVVILGLAASLVRDRRAVALEESHAQAVRFVSGAEAAINRNLLGLDVVLASMDKVLKISLSMRDWIDSEAADQLIEGAMRQNLLASRIALVDAQGQVVASSDQARQQQDLNLSDAFLAEVIAQPVSTLVMSAPTVSFRSGEVVLFVARHLRLADGSKLVALAEVSVAQLTTILVQGVDIAGLQATVERSSGELLVAAPATEEIVGKRLPPLRTTVRESGTITPQPARLSGAPALVVARNTMYGGVFITASIPVAAALQDVERETQLTLAVAGALALMVLLAGAAALLYLRHLTNVQANMSQAKETLDQALESMVSGFVLLDAQQRVVNWNRRFMEIHPWLKGLVTPQVAFAELSMVTARHLMPQATDDQRQQWVTERMAALHGQHESRQATTAEGTILEISERPTPEGGTVIVYQDVTRLQRAIADVEMLAFYDPLTGLPNRRLLNDRLQQAIISSQRTGQLGALLFLDLDHFKTLNDTAGHLVGDMLLQQVAQRLLAAVRDQDTVARLGGDEFVVMLQSLSHEPLEAALQTKKVGESILLNLNMPYHLQDAEHTSTCSVGATLFGGNDQDASELLKQADIAMYQVKTSGRNALCFFDPAMLSALTVRAEMERNLRHALAQQQFVLHYQVQMDESGRAVGAEVLIRWMHPEQGMVPPLQFIPLAEETGLILAIGEWVLRTACLQLKAWETEPAAAHLQLAVNVSARQFRSPDFVAQVHSILIETGIRPQSLKLELTESLVLDNIRDTIEKMHELKALGVRFSMDDFGTGYSSLSYLTRLPLDQLKIDQSFVRNIGQQASDLVVIETIIGLARSLGLEVIAEGVETTEQRDFLQRHGCLMYQGYLFGKPMPLNEFHHALHASQVAL